MGNVDSIKLLLKTLEEERPLVLFLGQDAWSSSARPDPILVALLQRLSRPDSISHGWRALLETSPFFTDEDMQWLTERFDRNVISEALQQVLDMPWSAVFTTSIDPFLSRRLETRGRQPESVLAKDHFARVPRSRARPPVYHLYGRTDQSTSDSRSPRSRLELLQRTATHTNEMLNRIGETVTPLGLLIVEGYSPGQDWLALDSLLAPLSTALGLQVLWFGTPSSCTSDFFPELTAKGSLLPHRERLVDVIAELRASGRLATTGSETPEEPGIVSLDGDKIITVAPSLRLRVEASAAIVDDTWTAFMPPLDGVARSEAFRRFHGNFGGPRNLVEGIAGGYAIKRDFERRLRQRVESTLQDQSDSDRIIIVHGQSGTGKTVSLARLAYELRKDAKLPVLYASGRVPLATDLEEFCLEAERSGAPGTVILCDGNQPVNRYRDLSNALRSRGRRIAVIGTSYRMENAPFKGGIDLIAAPPDVSAEEKSALTTLVGSFGGNSDRVANAPAETHILALIYRILSASRSRITSGVTGEVRATEEQLRQLARYIPSARFRTTLAEKMIEAGLHDGSVSLFPEKSEAGAFGSDAPGRFIDCVMAAGRLNCPVPVNLILRVLNSHDVAINLAEVSYLFEEMDIFRWRMNDAEGNDLLIAPRLQFEAELICRTRMSDRSYEIECLTKLIEGVRRNGLDRHSEIIFLLELLQKLDRNGPRSDAYKDGYLKIARALTILRTRHTVVDASLMLQESAFRRAALLSSQDTPDDENPDISSAERYLILNEAREVVETAIREISDGRLHAGRRTRENLQVERASIYGFLAVGRARSSANQDEVWSDYLAARTAITRATAIADSYFPFDVGLWTPFDILELVDLSKERRAEMMADMYAVMDQVDIDRLPENQRTKFLQRRMKLSSVLNNQQIGEEAFQLLARTKPEVAYFLRAREMCSGIFGKESGPFSKEIRSKALAAARFLEDRILAIRSDVRCLHLLLQLKWTATTGDRLLRGERRPIPYDKADRSELLAIVVDLNRAAGDGTRFVLRYLEATMEWINNNVTRAIELWRSVAHDTDYEDASRVHRRLFVADADSKPIMFRGRVESQRSEGYWRLKVDGVQGTVDLSERDFSQEHLQRGREIRNFAIAFNYVGPVADPASRYGGRL